MKKRNNNNKKKMAWQGPGSGGKVNPGAGGKGGEVTYRVSGRGKKRNKEKKSVVA